jgi:flagellar assembly protein FliH
MKVWRESIRFASPLREVRHQCRQGLSAEQQSDKEQKEREHAAYERGRQEGERALSEQLVRQRGELQELQNGVFESLRQALPQLIRESENVLLDVAMETAKKLIAEIPISSEMVEAAIRQALAQIEEAVEYEVFLHAEDIALLQQVNSPLLLPAGGEQRIHLKASPEATRGGCIVQTRFGIVDARRETKFEILKKAMLL